MSLQIVYVLTNASMPGFVKIGMTTGNDVGLRLGQLYTTGVPFPFDLVFACRVPNAEEVEKALHMAFAPYRPNPKREFFKIDTEQAVAILKLLHVEDATEEIAAMDSLVPAEEIAAAEQYKARRPNLNFKEMGITAGSMLHFTESDATVTVVGERKVALLGEEMSLTAATRRLLKLEYGVAPGPYWIYEGRSLRTIYNETYAAE